MKGSWGSVCDPSPGHTPMYSWISVESGVAGMWSMVTDRTTFYMSFEGGNDFCFSYIFGAVEPFG